jgi:hypothetical protein
MPPPVYGDESPKCHLNNPEEASDTAGLLAFNQFLRTSGATGSS